MRRRPSDSIYSLSTSKRQVTARPDGVKQVYFQHPDGYCIEVNDAGRSR
jgi:hypothetical protein